MSIMFKLHSVHRAIPCANFYGQCLISQNQCVYGIGQLLVDPVEHDVESCVQILQFCGYSDHVVFQFAVPELLKNSIRAARIVYEDDLLHRSRWVLKWGRVVARSENNGQRYYEEYERDICKRVTSVPNNKSA